ncbi:MAG: PhzF family phenazine biosynthesis protein [Bacteroidales bacterium]|nr:PhzF family phenazine biosynthesis protein [Bacteroidales bacterium]
MNKLPFFQVDAFASEPFRGNPAAVVILDRWPADSLLQKIAGENNLSETAFLLKSGSSYEIRWFSPSVEVDLCGHATLASAHILFHHYEQDTTRIRFENHYSGTLFVEKGERELTLDFPVDHIRPVELPEELISALGDCPVESYLGRTDYMLVFGEQQQIEDLSPDFHRLRAYKARGIIATAKGKEADFVSRFFAPAIDINEDPVTGSAHTTLTPYWARKLNKTELLAHQLSARGGTLHCRLAGDRVKISGRAVTYLEGSIFIPADEGSAKQ